MNLEDLVYEVFQDVIERDNGEVYVNCPFCEERGETADTRHRLGINVEIGKWNCFNCHFAGVDNPERIFYSLVRIFDLDKSEYKFSYRRSSKSDRPPSKKASITPVSLPNEFEPLWEKAREHIHKKALKYVLSRGISKEQIEDHFIGFCAIGEKAYRIVFPIYRKEKVIGYVSRAFVEDLEPKYLNSDGLKYVWNAPDEKVKRGILLEGVFDALASERALPKVHPMAGLGLSLTDIQLEAVTRFRELTIVPDPDKVGINGVIKRMQNIREVDKKIKLFVVMPRKSDKLDWGKLGETEKGLRKIRHAYERRIPWTKEMKIRLKARAAFQ